MTTQDFNTLAAVVYQFFGALDRRDHQATAQLVAKGGTWQRQGADLVGPDAVLAALEKRDPKRQTAHVVTNLWIEQASDTSARVRFYMSAYETLAGEDGKHGAPHFHGVRDCTDDLVREDGQWKIWWKKSRRFLPAE